jgi:hypothetical protein
MTWRFLAPTSLSSFTQKTFNKLHFYYSLSIFFFEHVIFESLFTFPLIAQDVILEYLASPHMGPTCGLKHFVPQKILG